ncbi:hypothetical protein EZS27_022930 [termite gut metagenome]|uniref:Uncharacterized protein n=1 Tax=termite gut metagenome TaxID=433724 RepID=A0A5J4R6C9_9ZZZZ
MRIKRYASHFLLLPEYGFLKQCVVEIGQERDVLCIFPLSEELETVEWHPGVILLSGKEEDKNRITQLFQIQYRLLSDIPAAFQTNIPIKQFVYLLYPFDFKRMVITGVTAILRLE